MLGLGPLVRQVFAEAASPRSRIHPHEHVRVPAPPPMDPLSHERCLGDMCIHSWEAWLPKGPPVHRKPLPGSSYRVPNHPTAPEASSHHPTYPPIRAASSDVS